MNPLISVIIPAYNVEPYINKCLESVINQTYKNIEIILVDDGSTDRSGHICDEYAQKDNRIKAIHQPNSGLSAARNAGLDAASGEWIAFLDSDDWISSDMYEVLLNLANEYDADIATCKTHDCPLGKDIPEFKDSGDTGVLFPEEIIAGLYTQEIVRFEVWNKIWKRNLIGNTRFIPGQVSEDIHFDRILFLQTNKMAYINKTLHHYLVARPGSTLSSFKKGRMCVFEEFLKLVNDISNRFSQDTIAAVASIAGGFAISMYAEAIHCKISKEIKEELMQQYQYFLPLYKNTRYENRIAEFSFRFSPLLYYFLLIARKSI